MKRLLNRKGAGIVEYALITALLAVGIVAAMITLKNTLNTKFSNINTNVGSGAPTN